MSYDVTRRTREIGVRVALGAQQGNVRWMILRETFASRLALLLVLLPPDSSPACFSDFLPATFQPIVRACLLLLAVAFVAGYLPARRASSIDPILALRTE